MLRIPLALRFTSVLTFLASLACSSRATDPKLALIDRIDDALRRSDAEALVAELMTPERALALCPTPPETERVARRKELADDHATAVRAVTECLAVGAWEDARPLALNYGSRVHDPAAGCDAAYRTLEKSELYYGTRDKVLKVTVHGYLDGAKAGLARALRCVVKDGDPREAERDLARVGTCRIGRWPAVTQVRGALECE